MRPTGATESSQVAPRRSPKKAAAARGRRTRPSEAYGFVGSIAALAAALAYLAWAYAPEPWLRYIGATYYPNKQWAVAVPAFVAVAVAQGVVLYVASNFLLSPPPASFDTISGNVELLPGPGPLPPGGPGRSPLCPGLWAGPADEHAQDPASSPGTGADRPVEPISDVCIDRMNSLMFGDQGSRFIHFQEDGVD